MKLKIKFFLCIIIFVAIFSLIFLNKSYFYNLIFNREDGQVLKEPASKEDINIIFFHHSTGKNIWNGGVQDWFKNYNQQKKVNYSIVDQDFPKKNPYGWNNYPFDYWNIWVKNAGEEPFMEEPTLEIISKIYDVVIIKHCFPVGNIEDDTGNPNVDSDEKRLENYKLQYEELKEKMKEFNKTKFIIWTIPALVENKTTEEKALRAREFYNWVKNEWDQKGDNIYLWDFYKLETEDDLYLKNEYAETPENSHPNKSFSNTVASYFCQRIVDVIEGRGDNSNITGIITEK